MKTIYIVWHKKPHAYGDAWTLVRAFESEADAHNEVEVWRPVVSGDLKVESAGLAPSTGSVLAAPAIPRFREIDATPRAALP